MEQETEKKIRGRGFLPLVGPADQAALGNYLKERIAINGGRAAVSERMGVRPDLLSKWTTGRSSPSRDSLQKLFDAGLFEVETMEELANTTPWRADQYRSTRGKKVRRNRLNRVAPNREIAPVTEVVRGNLLDTILEEPNLSVRQRGQIAALVTMIVSGVDLQIEISPR